MERLKMLEYLVYFISRESIGYGGNSGSFKSELKTRVL